MKLPPRIIAFFVILGFIAHYFWRHPPNPWTWMQTLGVFLVAMALPLWVTAHIQLGSSFSALPQARTLVTHGLYAKCRNPIYLFGFLGIAGIFLLLGRRYLLLLLVFVIPLQILRMRREARVLEEKFGDEYRSYRQGTWF